MIDWRRAREIFEAALDLATSERESYLDDACDGDVELRNCVTDLLTADATDAAALIERPLPDLVNEVAFAAVTIGSRVGNYGIVGLLGAGGMGAVYRAEQEQPRRVVALKVMRAGLVSAVARQRFEFEAEVLGRLSHPGIAQVFEAGTHVDPATGAELPFFVMEHVDGARGLDRFVAEAGLDLRRRLELFVELCAAVQHGHQLGVLHRDLKPANVLIDRHGRPKIIDFGIARAAPGSGESSATLTQAGQVLGTLAYMAPERFANGNTDARADVYSLGVILYELLTGTPPFASTKDALAAATQRSTQPRRPSRLETSLPADLDWVVARAMAHDTADRYASVSELAADVGRFLAQQPVLAGPPSTLYVLRKFVRRNRLLVTLASVACVALVIGGTAAAIGWVQTGKAERRAVERAAEAERELETQRAVTGYLQRMIAAARDDRDGREVRVVDLLEQADAEIARLATVRPAVALALQETVASTFLTLGMAAAARQHLERARPAAREHLGPLHATTLVLDHDHGAALDQLGDSQQAEAVLREVLHGYDRIGRATSADAAYSHQVLGRALQNQGRLAEAAEEYRRALAIFATQLGESDWTTLATSLSLIGVQREQRQLTDAETGARALLARAESALGTDAAVTNGVRSTLGQVLNDTGRFDEAEPLLRATVAALRQTYGDHSHSTLGAWNDLAVVLTNLQRYAEAAECLRAVVEANEAIAEQPDHALIARHNLAVALERAGDLDAAGREFATLMARAPEVFPEQHWLQGLFRKSHGVYLTRRSDFAAAERELLSGLELLTAALGDDDRRVQAALVALIAVYEQSDRAGLADPFRARLR